MDIDELKFRRSKLQHEIRDFVQGRVLAFHTDTGIAVTDVTMQLTPVTTLSGDMQSPIVSSVSVRLDLE